MKLAWSKLAANELRDLYGYSVERWGRDVAHRYLEDVRAAAKKLAADPGSARLIRAPFRLLRVRSHILFAHVDEAAAQVTIARVLHAAMDIERHLP